MNNMCCNITGWNKIRNSILDRDNFNCRMCTEENNLHVHHIDYCRSNNESSNLVTLCRTCHSAIHRESYKPFEHEDYPAPWEKSNPEAFDEFNQEVAW